jgi:hypothetical protein
MSDPEPHDLQFEIDRQPDDVTCGATCLHAVYRYFGDTFALDDLMAEVPSLEHGGTLGVLLANHALAQGYRATIVTWNLQLFDPTWFREGGPPLRERMLERARVREDSRLRQAAAAYDEFLSAGGTIEMRDLDPPLLRRYLARKLPILTGLSATFLYRESRERGHDNVEDDVRGDPVGHFVVLSGYLPKTREILVSDPQHPNPLSQIHTYRVPIEHVIGAIYLGVLTYDANLVVIEPADGGRPGAPT